MVKGLHLQDRDRALLELLFRYRYLDVDRLQHWVFGGSRQVAIRRLRRLAQEGGYLDVFELEHFNRRLVRLARKGVLLVGEQARADEDEIAIELKRNRPDSATFVEHFLEIADVRWALERAVASIDGLEHLGFIPEFIGIKTGKRGLASAIRDQVAAFDGGDGPIGHTPDGVFALARDGEFGLYFLEVDRGSMTVDDASKGVIKHIRFYLSYLASRRFERFGAEFGVGLEFGSFRALFVVSCQERIERIRRVAASLKNTPRQLLDAVWLTSKESLSSETVLGPIWTSLDPRIGERSRIYDGRR